MHYLASERSIVWLDDPTKYRFVRERIYKQQHATARPPDIGSTGRVVAFAVLDPKNRDPERCRRVWLSRPDDDLYPDGRCPFEGVCPSSIAAGVPSRQPQEAE